MPPSPHHAVVWFVAKDGDVAAAHQIGNAAQVLPGRDAARGIVWAVEEDGLGMTIFGQESFDIAQLRPEVVLLLQIGDPRSGPRAVRCWASTWEIAD